MTEQIQTSDAQVYFFLFFFYCVDHSLKLISMSEKVSGLRM